MSLSDQETKKILRELGRVIESVGGRDASMIGRFIKHLGGLAPLLDYLAESQSTGGRPTANDYREAANAVGEAYRGINETGTIDAPPVVRRVGRPGQDSPVRRIGRSDEIFPSDLVEDYERRQAERNTAIDASGNVLPTLAAPQIDDGGPNDVLSNMIETPASSNVFAFGYDSVNKILYVQFKAPGEVTHYKDATNACTGEKYRVGHRPHAPGPIYAYGSKARPVPEKVFEQMLTASSKGSFVWQNLRVCGSSHEHQYPHTLVSPSMAGGNMYVPRKATSRGFRVRTVPTVGKGRRPAERSTLAGYNENRLSRNIRRL